MPIKLLSASKTIEPIGEPPEDEEIQVEKSSTLADLMVVFRQPDLKKFFSKDDLSRRGITIISLPGLDTLLTNEGPFRPHSTFQTDIPLEIQYNIDELVNGDERLDLECLARVARENFEAEVTSKGLKLPFRGFDSQWREIFWKDPFYGFLDGLKGFQTREEFIWRPYVLEWGHLEPNYLEPEESKSLATKPPHVRLTLDLETTGQESGLSRIEMRSIITAIYNRVYEQGFEDETIFPVLLFSSYKSHLMRITEAVFEKTYDKLTLRITPLYSFMENRTAPWDAFLRMEASVPRVSASNAR